MCAVNERADAEGREEGESRGGDVENQDDDREPSQGRKLRSGSRGLGVRAPEKQRFAGGRGKSVVAETRHPALFAREAHAQWIRKSVGRREGRDDG